MINDKWLKSRFSNPSGNSVEVRLNPAALHDPDGQVEIRESDDPTRVVKTSQEKFKAFVEGVKAGQFDLP